VKEATVDCIRYETSDVTISDEEFGGIKVTGRVENTTDEDGSLVVVAVFLYDENGDFIKSGVRIRDPRWQTEEGRREMFPKEEVTQEIRAQYNRFVELTGKQPGYLHGHSISYETYNEAIEELSEETGIPYSMKFLKEKGAVMAGMHMSTASKNKTFDPFEQLNKDTKADVLRDKDLILSSDLALIICHPGYMDADLITMTSLSIERVKDLAMMVDPEIKRFVEENNIELITYRDLL
jgi:predicted glycoside hydrolase/deacetylase ChbG (UPF0249 family)